MNISMKSLCVGMLTWSLVAIPFVHAADNPDDVLSKAVSARADWEKSASSIQLKYDWEERTAPWAIELFYPLTGADHTKTLVLTKHVESARIGDKDKYYYHSIVNGLPQKEIKYDCVFDGKLAARWFSLIPGMTVGRDLQYFRPGNPEPLEMLDVESPSELKKMVNTGELKYTGCELSTNNGEPLAKITFRSTGRHNQAGYTTEVLYDAGRDFMTRSFRYIDPSGNLLIETSDIRLKSFNVAGHVLYYPLNGTLNAYSPGNGLRQTTIIKIADNEGVVFNPEIDAKKFVMKPLPGQQVIEQPSWPNGH